MRRPPRDQRRRAPQRPFLDRYGYRILSALVLLAVALAGVYIYLQASRPAFACTSLLTPPPATPTPVVTATPRPTPTPTPTPSPTLEPSPTPKPSPTPEPTPWLGFGVTDRGRNHVLPGGETIRYAECPPTSGPHSPSPAKRGYYGPDQNLPVGAWVHSLEHGLIVVLYSCGQDGDACPDQATRDALRQLADTAPQTDAAAVCQIRNKIIVARFDQMSTRFAALGWDRAMLSNEYDAGTFLTFYGQWVDNSPTDEARGCDGPTGAQ